MPDARLQVVIEAVDRTQAALSGAMSTLENYRRRLRSMAIAFSAFGIAGMAAFAVSIKAAKDAEDAQRRLDFALQQQGLSYANLRPEIEATLGSLRRNTNFGLTPMYETLKDLIETTGDWEWALKLLPAAVDVAAAIGKPLGEAADLVAKAVDGNRDALKKLGLEADITKSPMERLKDITIKYKDAAKDAYDPTIALKEELGNVGKMIGLVALPMVRDLAEKVKDAVEWFERWPKPIRDVTIALGLAATAVATLTAALLGFAVMLAIVGIELLPILLVIAGITAALAAAILMWMYWGKIVKWVGAVFGDLKGVFLGVLSAILAPFVLFINVIIAGINLLVKGLNAIRWLTRLGPIEPIPPFVPGFMFRAGQVGETAGPPPEVPGGLRPQSLAALMGDILEALRQAARPQTIIIEIDGRQVAAAIGHRAEVQEQVRS